MGSGRQPPMGTPQLSTHAGLTPQMSIVDANGRPTMFFFRWLLTIGGAALTASDLDILESFDPGADAALTEGAIADAIDAAGVAAGFEDSVAARADLLARIESLALAGASSDPALAEAITGTQRFLEALIAAPAPAVAPDAALADTLANWTLANYNPANYATGRQFLVTTWNVTYADAAGVWIYSSGTYIAPAAARPATGFNGAPLSAADAGLWFLASDTGALSYWNGAAWLSIGASVNTVTPFTPVVQIGGSSAGITTTGTGTSIRIGTGTGSVVIVAINVTVTAWPASPSGNVTIGGVPIGPVTSVIGIFSANSNFVGLTPGGVIIPYLSAAAVFTLYTQGATGRVALPASAIAAGAVFVLDASYPSA